MTQVLTLSVHYKVTLQKVLKQMVMNLIQEFSGTDREGTIQWLDHVKAISRKMGFNILEIGMG